MSAAAGWLSRAVKEIVVYKSVSDQVWANLAFEDWLLKNVDFSSRRILFLWRNSGCIVIGRHQNPWLEANIPLLRERGVGLARRRSGGGAVYHDLGNLNCTLFTHRHDYSRPRTLRLVCAALNDGWGAGLDVNHRDDIVWNTRWKVSGSSSRLVRDSAYHHFTLLLDVDTTNLHQLLRPHPHLHFSHSSATPSTRSEVMNLGRVTPGLGFDEACAAIAGRFYDEHGVTENRKIVELDPTSEITLPGVTEMQTELQDWKWNYGKTPKFSVTSEETFSFGHLVLTLEVVHGIISSCSVSITTDQSDTALHHTLEDLRSALTGSRLWSSDLAMVVRPFLTTSELHEVYTWLTNLY